MRVIRNIVFDMGQVLIWWTPALMTAHIPLGDEDRALLIREVFGNVEWVRLDRGTLTGEEAAEKICARLPERLHVHAHFLVKEWWSLELKPVAGMAAVVRDLKEAGYGIYLLSNANIQLRENFHRIPGAEYFDGLLVSSEEKMIKPHREIYGRLFERFSLVPEECFFIDDAPANIEGALMAGMPGAVFCGDTARLRRELQEQGILKPEG